MISIMSEPISATVITPVAESKEVPGPGKALWSLVRGRLIAAGWSDFASWCRAEGLDSQRTKNAIFGLSDTEEAREHRERAMRAAGLIESGEKD